MAVKASIAFYRGEDVTLTVTMTPAADITGWTLAFTVRRRYGDLVVLTKTTTASGITITDPAVGVFKVTLASADTKDLPPGSYVFDIQRTDGGSRTVLTIGELTLHPEVAVLP